MRERERGDETEGRELEMLANWVKFCYFDFVSDSEVHCISSTLF